MAQRRLRLHLQSSLGLGVAGFAPIICDTGGINAAVSYSMMEMTAEVVGSKAITIVREDLMHHVISNV